ncbi:MAG: SBBP repeat-containing protein [Bryobacteraceae bacterium]|nr:SBBP repeat-containing protein [Bryobacteraceae bacterium]
MALLLVLAFVIVSGPMPARRAPADGPTARLGDQFGSLPLYFIENRGQTDERVGYYLHGGSASVFFTSGGVVFALRELQPRPAESPFQPASYRQPEVEGWAVKLAFVGANPGARPVGVEQTSAIVSYFTGPPDRWKTGLPTYAGVTYSDLWPGIDLHYEGTGGRLKYTLTVAPGVDPSRIRLAYQGASEVRVNGQGKLEIDTPAGGFSEDAPYVYQEIDGRRVEVAAVYDLAGGVFGFRLASYDRALPLHIDPAVLIYSGYIGGSGTDIGYKIAVDNLGAAYLVGDTLSSDCPTTTGAFKNRPAGNMRDIYVAKVNTAGTGLVYAGYLGGSDGDFSTDIALDSSKNAYIVGETRSANFPKTVGKTCGSEGDGFIAKINASGNALVYARCIGGATWERAYGVAVGSQGNAYVTGSTDSTDFPATLQSGPNGGIDAFLVKLSAAGDAVNFALRLGGAGEEIAFGGVAVDPLGNAYVTGRTSSSDFPVTGGWPYNSYQGTYDAYVAKVTSAGAVAYSGYLGGANEDRGLDLAVDSTGSAYITGWTLSGNFPVTAGWPYPTYNTGDRDAFIVKVNYQGTSLDYSGYLGDSHRDFGNAIAVNSSGEAYITGTTQSENFPYLGMGTEFQCKNKGAPAANAFVAKLDAAGTKLLYSGCLGGKTADNTVTPSADVGPTDYGNGIAVDSSGNVYITGETRSSDFPVVGMGSSFSNKTGTDSFVAKISDVPACSYQVSPLSNSIGAAGGAGSATVTTDAGCAWTVASNNAWITATPPASRVGSGSADYTVAANSTGSSRNGTLTIAGKTHTVTQAAEAITAPVAPTGTTLITPGTSYSYTTGGATSDLGHSLQYYFDWGDGTNSGWLAAGVTSASHSWASAGTYSVKARARCVTHTALVSAWSNVLSVSAESVSKPNTPAGTANITPGTNYTYTTGGAVSSAGHPVQYFFDWGDGTNSGWLATGVTSASHSWASAGSYSVKAMARCATHNAIESAWSNVLTVGTAESVSAPNTPTGTTNITPGTNYTYTTGGATSSLGHQVQYFFDWGDGTTSGWLATGVASASHSWASAGSYSVKAMARCATHNAVQSAWSNVLTVGAAESVSTPNTPSGTANITPGTSYTYTTGGATSNAGHPVQYFFDWGDGTNSGWLATGVTSASHSWASAGSYSVKAMARCATHNTVQSGWSAILTVGAESVSTPNTPTGTANITPGTSYTYTTGGAASNFSHPVQYFFDWGDGTNSGWLATGVTSASHSWASAGSYSVKAMARCATHNAVQSAWSSNLTVVAGVKPGSPTNPSPANNATGISTIPTLTWTADSGATSHDVYFGASSSPPLVANVTNASYAPGTLNAGTKYYWRVVAKNSAGSTTSTTWSFTTQPPPGSPANPSPGNNATGISTTPTLTWTAGSGADSHDVYFGASSPPPFVANAANTTYSPGTLNAGTKYYWRVVAKNSGGSTSSTTWSFTTANVPTYSISGKVTKGGAGLAGVTVTLTGGPGGTRTTSATGDYSFTGLPAGGPYTVTPALAGSTFQPPSRTYNNLSSNQSGADFTAASGLLAAGVFLNGQWYLDVNANGIWEPGIDQQADFGWAGTTQVVGDWNGNGKTNIGVFSDGAWYLDYNGNGRWDGPTVDRAYSFGWAGVTPIVGDWNGDGKTKIGVFSNGAWYLDYNGNGLWEGTAVDRGYSFGWAGVTPIVGDWSGDKKTKVGVFSDGAWYLDYNGNGLWEGVAIDRAYSFGWAGVTPLVGDWTGDGKTKIAVFKDGAWYLDLNGNGVWESTIDRYSGFGWAGVTPLVGDWNGDGKAEIAVFSDGGWYLDFNGNGVWDGVAADRGFGFGWPGVKPVTGKW